MRRSARTLRACDAFRFPWQLEDWWLAVYQPRGRSIGRSRGLRRHETGLDGGTGLYRRHVVSRFRDLRRSYERVGKRNDALRMDGS